MATTIGAAARCDRCQRVTYECRVDDGGRTLCPRCVGELRDLLRDWMRNGRRT